MKTSNNRSLIERDKEMHVLNHNLGIYEYNKERNKHLYYVKPPKIRYLVISGGGAKGVMLPGVLKILENYYPDSDIDQTLIEGLYGVVGASVGAMTQGLLAAGITAQELKKAANAAGGKKILGTGTLNLYHFDGGPLHNFIRDNMWASIRARLCDIYQIENSPENMQHLIHGLLNENICDLDLLKPVFDYLNDENKKGPISFALLHYLHKFSPKHFKNLIVTATYNGTENETAGLYVFSYENTPWLDAVTACHASGALPKILNSVEIPIEALKGGKLESMLPPLKSLIFSDGGYLDNIPVCCIPDLDINDEFDRLSALTVVFDEAPLILDQSPILNARNSQAGVYQPRKRDRLIQDVIPKYGKTAIKTSEKNTEKKLEKLELMRTHFTQRTILLRSDLKTTHFSKADQFSDHYELLGETIAKEYQKMHENELVYYIEADSEEELLIKVSASRFRYDLENILNKTVYQNSQSLILNTLSTSPKNKSHLSQITENILRLTSVQYSCDYSSINYKDPLQRSHYNVLYADLVDNLDNQLDAGKKILNILKILMTHFYDAHFSNDKAHKNAAYDAIQYLISANKNVYNVCGQIILNENRRLINTHTLLACMYPETYKALDKFYIFEEFLKSLRTIIIDNNPFWVGKGISKIGRTHKIPDCITEIADILNNPKFYSDEKYYIIQNLIESYLDSKKPESIETINLYKAIQNCCNLPEFFKMNCLVKFIQEHFPQNNEIENQQQVLMADNTGKMHAASIQ